MSATSGTQYLALRPLLVDYVLSMPRGAQVIYPKDSAQIVTEGDIFPGARVLEAGAGSGALTCSLLRAVVRTVRSARTRCVRITPNTPSATSRRSSAAPPTIGGSSSTIWPTTIRRPVRPHHSDMLAPWEPLDVVRRTLKPGSPGDLCRDRHSVVAGDGELRDQECWTEPRAWESMVREWSAVGLAVRPEHRMQGHTAFLITARRLADGTTTLVHSADRPRADVRTGSVGSSRKHHAHTGATHI